MPRSPDFVLVRGLEYSQPYLQLEDHAVHWTEQTTTSVRYFVDVQCALSV